jgi:ankyrin repeat protein
MEKYFLARDYFYEIIKNGSLEQIENFIIAGANLSERDIYEATALHKAVAVHRIDAVQLLINYGASVNDRKRDGSTPLMDLVYRISWD